MDGTVVVIGARVSEGVGELLISIQDRRREFLPRLDYMGGRPVAALVYQRHKHFINLFIWPATGSLDAAEKSVSRQGYNLLRWTQSGMTYWVVSDLNSRELQQFVALFK